jgi:peptide/nickel transport system substrate-binding protein
VGKKEMQKLRWQIIIALIAVAAIAILLIGQKPQAESLSPEPTTGGVFVEALIGAPSRFNPLLAYDNPVDKDVTRLIFSGLIKFDSMGNPQPDLAESYGVSISADVFNVTLRKNALWHDGTPVTAEDVLFTVDLMRNAEMPVPADIRELWNSVEVIAFDALNIQFRLKESYAPFIDYLSFGILPKHILGGKSPQEIINDSYNLAPVGTGPYKFVELRTENGQITGVVVQAFDDYYLRPPWIEEFVFRFFPSTAEALDAYRNGKVSGIGYIDPSTLDDVLSEPGLNVYTARLPQMSIILFNLDNDDKPFLSDLEFRKAMLMALNRPWMIDQALDGQAVVANGVILPGTWAYYDNVTRYDFDPNKAIEILREAGYRLPPNGTVREKDGIQLGFDLVYPNTEKHAALAQMIQVYWANVGVFVNLVPVENDVLLQNYLDPRTYDAALVDLTIAGSPDPDPYPFWHQAMITGGQNYSKWDDRRASEYLEKARITPDRFERSRLYKNFQVHFARELPALPLFFPMYSYAVDNEVLGIQLGPIYDPSDRFNTIQDWFLEARPKSISPEE